MQIKWKKISQYCIESNNIYISRYKLADGANRYVLWHNNKMIKIHDEAKVLKDEAMAIITRELSEPKDLFGKLTSSR